MKTLYNSRKKSVKTDKSELKVRTVLNKHFSFPFRVTFCCILFLFSYTTGISQSALVNTNKPSYFPGENVVITGSVWQPGEAVTIIISKIGSTPEADTIVLLPDGAGNFQNSSYTIETTNEETFYTVKASSLSKIAPDANFSNKLGLAQSHNGGIGDTPVSPVVWVNGNAHGQNSHYIEGNSIPYRVILKDVPIGIHTIRIKWDIKHGDKHALDFITSSKRLPAFGGINEIVDPRSDLPLGVFDNPTYFAIPTPAAAMVVNGKPQPTTSFLGLPASDRMMEAFNATILSMQYVYEGNILDANSTTELEISYQVVGAEKPVIFSWGGHIANRIDWGPGSSCASINGSPYHTALGISDHINGAQDRSLKTDAVQFFPTCDLTALPPSCPGDTISVTASTDAPSPQFTWGATNGAIILGSGATVQVIVPPSGTYTVSVTIVDFFENQVISESTTCSVEGSVLVDPVVAAGADQEQCLAIDGRDFEVTGSVSSGSFEWVVVSGTAVIDSPNSLTTMVHLDANSNEVVLRLQAIGSCTDQKDDLTLKVNIEPIVEIETDDAPACDDETAEYSVAAVQGHTYQWSISGDAQIDGASNGSSVSIITDNLCSVDYILSVAVTDENGCIGYDTLSVSFSDSVAPIITGGPGADATIACPAEPSFTAPTASDNCTAIPTIHQLTDVVDAGNCAAEYSVTRRWYFSDECGNLSDTVSQTINVVDTLAPVITGGPGADATIACPATPSFTAPTASDNCTANPTIHQLTDVVDAGNCAAEYTVTRSWYFSDECGNLSDTVSQTINVVDTIAPVIAGGPGADATIACPATPSFTAPTASDNCTANPTIHQLTDVVDAGNCAAEYTVTRSWYFSDECGNLSDTVSQTINVVDTIAPVIAGGPGADATIACPATPSFTAPTASDNCTANPTIHQLTDVVDAGNCAAEYTVTRSWYFSDECGNLSDTVSQTINVVDTIAPVITDGPGAEATISCPGNPEFEFEAPSATDNCDEEPELVQLDDETVEGNCAAEYSVTRSWYFIDACGNISDTVSQTVNVVDQDSPIISDGPGADTTISCPGTPEFEAPSAIDNCDEEPELVQLDDETVEGNCAAEYSVTRSWYFIDACGNISDTVSQTITVVDDEAPVLSQGPGEDATIDCTTEPEFTAPEFTDNCSTFDLIASDIDTSYVNDQMVLTMTWYAQDACGNISDSVDQAITIEPCDVDVFCSLTQGFYGNAKGVACATGERGRALMLRLLGADFGPMIIGSGGRTLTINATNVDCLIGDMPAGGPASILPFGNAVYGANCALPSGYFGNNGNNSKFKNVLLGQVITLGLNLRLDAELSTVQLEGNTMITYGAESSYDGVCGTEDDVMDSEDVLERSIPNSVLNALDAQYGGDRSIGNLYLLANRMLGGEAISGVSLSNINKAVSAMNEGFDHCRFLGGFYNSREEDEGVSELSTDKELNYKVYPNPFSLSTTIEFVVDESQDVRIEIYSAKGELVTTLFNEKAEGRINYQVMLDGSMFENGMYFCRIYANDTVFESKIILNK